MKTKGIIILLILFFIIVGVFYVYSKLLPDSFTIKFTFQYRTAGASGRYNTILTFEDNQLVSGTHEYNREGDITQCSFDISSLKWIQKDGKDCNTGYQNAIPLYKKQLQRDLILGKYKPAGSDGCDTYYDDYHSYVCYQII